MGDNSGRAGRQDIDEAADRLLIKSCPPYRALVVLARTALVRQINWKTTQQGVSRTTSHHQRRTGKTILTRTRLTRSMSVARFILERLFDNERSRTLIERMCGGADVGPANDRKLSEIDAVLTEGVMRSLVDQLSVVWNQ